MMSVELKEPHDNENENVQPERVEPITLESAAQTALEEYHNCIRAKIIGRAMVESADAATSALNALTQSHTRTVETLHSQISNLQDQLCGAAALIEKLGGQVVNESMRLSSSSSSFMATTAAIPPQRGSFAIDIYSSSREEGGVDNQLQQQQLQQQPAKIEESNDDNNNSRISVEAASSDAFATAQSGGRGTAGEGEIMESSNSLLFAELVEGRGTLKLQEQQRSVMVKQIQELTTLLAKVVKENADYRQEIRLLRATTIPITEHQQLLEERNALEQECTSMKLELKRLEEELEAALTDNSALLPPHPTMMMMMRTLDTTIQRDEALSGLQTSTPLFSSHPFSQQQQQQEQEKQKEKEKESVDTTLESTTTEGGFHAAQSMMRMEESSKHVLDTSQDAPQLQFQHTGLWKNAIRELEQQATLAASQISAAERLREAEGRIEELETCNTELRTSLDNLKAEDKCVREDCEQLIFRNGVLSHQVSSLLVRVEQQRRALQRCEEHHLNKEDNQNNNNDNDDEEEDVYSVADSEILLEGEVPTRREPRGQVASAAQSLLEHRHTVSAYYPTEQRRRRRETAAVELNGVSSLLDVSLQSTGGPLEVEGGVRTGLGVFARTSYRPRRSLLLRNFGSPTVEVEHTRVPRLPASDQLSGVALGRPSYYTTVNPIRNITAQRGSNNNNNNNNNSNSGGALVYSGGESHNSGRSSNSSSNNNNININNSEDRKRRRIRREHLLGSVATTLVVSEDSEENRRFLEILREDENFDRYSVNSVLELLQRNQELLKQLYLATQRADTAEEKLQLQLQQQKEKEEKEGRSRSNSDTEAAQGHPLNSRKRKRESSPSAFHIPPVQREMESDIMRGSSAEGVLDCGVVFSNTSASMNTQHEEKQTQQSEENEDMKRVKQLSLVGLDERYMQLESHVDGHIDAVLQKHEAELTFTDKSLAASLLRIMELGRRSSVNNNNNNNNNNNTKDDATETMKDTVIASLVRVCTQQGVRVAQQSIELAAAQQSCYAEMMRECWNEAQRVLLRSAADLQSAITRLPIASNPSMISTGDASHIIGKVETEISGSEGDELQLLQNIASLLRTASLKEHTIQRVLSLASQRQRMIQQTIVEPGHVMNNNTNTDDNNNNNAEEDDGDNDSNISTLDEDDNNDHYTLQQLSKQLFEAQTQYNKLRESYHEERKQHTVLLDRMWRLEEEMVSAVRSREEAQERMATMMTREEYETTVAALDNANTTIADLQTQLQQAEETNKLQLQDVEHWRTASVESERRRVADTALVGGQLAEKDRLIAHHVEQHRLLELRCTEQQERVHQLEMEAEQHRNEMMERDENVKALQEQLHRVELALLEQNCTQDLLFSIFPGDRALAENRNLIQSMREEKVKLTETMTALQLERDEIKRELAAAQLEIHNAVQARQEAELHLQESMLTRTAVEERVILSPSASTSITTFPNTNMNTISAAAVGVTEETNTTTMSFRLLELESLQRANASLLVERGELMEREALLRAQLEALGRDPISENARRYGLKATRSFEEQLGEINERCVALQEKLTFAEELRTTVQQLESEITSLTAQLENAKKALAEQQETNTVRQEEIQDTTASLEKMTESYEAAKLTLEEKEEQIRNNADEINNLETEVKKLEQKLREGDEERERLCEDNLRLINSVTALAEEVKKKEAERKAAQASLAQGLASASSHRLRGRSAGGSSGVVPVSFTGSLGRSSP